MIEVTLPWPDKRLSPNARVHWRKRYEAAREAQTIAKVIARNKLIRWFPPEELQARYEFCPPDKRRRDQDNFLSMMKPYQDGVCDVYRIDDSHIKRTVLEWGEVVTGGKVVLRLEEME